MANASTSSTKKQPITIITIGMAGAGKSTFVQRLNSYLHSLHPPSPPYILNLDPAVTSVPYEANIDIRDTVNYKEVMKQFVCLTWVVTAIKWDFGAWRYNLGPNGGILTALNLFTTKFDQVLQLVEKRADSVEWVHFFSARPCFFDFMVKVHYFGYTGADWDLYVVSFWCDYYRRSCNFVPNGRGLCYWYAADDSPCNVYVEYAVRLQVCPKSIILFNDYPRPSWPFLV